MLAVIVQKGFLYHRFYQASQAWMEWLIKKRKAFDQRGDMAIAAWAEQQQREMNLRARRLSHSKVTSNAFWSTKKYPFEYYNVNPLKGLSLVHLCFWLHKFFLMTNGLGF